ncbi:MAG TPA: hypothetical protein VHB68_13640, partial [Steroidobacteraceae bacterium]|nr:hypothetical protein [Steroidobacteraceae bacterium]
MSAHRQNPAFGRLCDTIAWRRLVAVTGSGVSAGLESRGSRADGLPTWRTVLAELRARFADQLHD